MHFCHVTPFSCCIHVALFSLFMLHSSHVALVYYWKILKMNGRQKTQPKSDLTTRVLSLCSFEWLIKWKGTNLLFCLKIICLPRLETFETRVWFEIISTRHKMSSGYFNYDFENEWTQKKIYSCWKKARVFINLF